ncbi:hypothetical protein HID58_067385 [Brassica napus]|uniref:Uncharacterized protein n=1 Tax=Brassica napus TaxID=3708 RepID=A0ABQ7ZIE5_BRANA|nr:hypothetical protein HID58_067385 [Brassica napus]
MTRLERLSIGIAIITEKVIIAENSSFLIPKGRLLAYKNYDSLSKLAWDPLCLHWDLTRAPRITEVLEVEKKNNEKTQDEEEQQVEVDAEFGDGDKERETSKINETREEEEEQMEADTEVEEPVQVERQKRGRGNKINNSLSNGL